MAVIRIPSSALALLPFCAKHTEANEQTCFETYAHMIATSAAIGYHQCVPHVPSLCRSFIAQPLPIDLAIFRSQTLLPQLLAIAMSCFDSADEAIDESKLVKIIEDLADIGLREMEKILANVGETEFPWKLAYWIANPPSVDPDTI